MFAPGDLLNYLSPTCSCGAVFDDRACAPHILPCSHTFCFNCLSKEKQQKKKRCMKCDKKYKKPKLNIALAEAIERIRFRKDVVDRHSRRCDECDYRWPLSQMRRCSGCELDIAHVIGNAPGVECIVCLECAVDRHAGHSIVRVIQPPTYFNEHYRNSMTSSGRSSTDSRVSPISSIKSGGTAISLPQVQFHHRNASNYDPPRNMPSVSSSFRGCHGKGRLTITVKNDEKIVEETSPVYYSTRSNSNTADPLPVHKPSHAGVTINRLSALMKKRETQRINERNSRQENVQTEQPSSSSGFSTDNECDEIKDLTYATVFDEVVPSGDVFMVRNASEPVSSFGGRPLGAYVNMISRSVECLSRSGKNNSNYCYVY